MKTISEMQVLIKDAYSKLEELSKSLNEYSSSGNLSTTVDYEKLKVIARRSPLDGHTLTNADDVIKKQYITILISLIYLAKENQEKGWLFIQRIACGAKVKNELQELSADALSLTEKQLDYFSESIIYENLTTVFILDCMLLYLSCEHKNRKMLEFISNLIELVKCNESEVNEVTEIATIVATQNSSAYFDYCLTDIKINLCESLCYIMPTKATIVNTLEEARVVNNEHVIIFNSEISNINEIINLDDFSSKTIEFLYCKFENIQGIKSSNKNIVFKNSIFSNIYLAINSNNNGRSGFFYMTKVLEGRSYETDDKLSIIESDNCQISHCNFRNCSVSNYLILIKKGNIVDCIFEECLALDMPSDKYLIELYGGKIENCKFNKCSIRTNCDKRTSTTTGILKLSQSSIRNSEFLDCKSFCDSSYGSYSHYKSYILFLCNSSAEQCNFIDCYCTSKDSSNKTCVNYIIALQNSSERDNSFLKCSSYHYNYSEIGRNINVGSV